MTTRRIPNLMKVVALLAVGALLIGWGASRKTRQSAPLQIPYQGTLERDGVLVNAVDETVDFRVSLYNSAADGEKLWPAGQDVYDEHSVNVYSGRFAFNIGSDQEYRPLDDTPLYLDIQVKMAADVDFVPLAGRQQFLYSPQAVTATFGVVPIGSIVAWHPNASDPPLSLPVGWELCDGGAVQTVDSPLFGTMKPNLNLPVLAGTKGRFLRGHSVSGQEELSALESHNHPVDDCCVTYHTNTWSGGGSASGGYVVYVANTQENTYDTGDIETRPHSFSVVWIMRVK